MEKQGEKYTITPLGSYTIFFNINGAGFDLEITSPLSEFRKEAFQKLQDAANRADGLQIKCNEATDEINRLSILCGETGLEKEAETQRADRATDLLRGCRPYLGLVNSRQNDVIKESVDAFLSNAPAAEKKEGDLITPLFPIPVSNGEVFGTALPAQQSQSGVIFDMSPPPAVDWEAKYREAMALLIRLKDYEIYQKGSVEYQDGRCMIIESEIESLADSASAEKGAGE